VNQLEELNLTSAKNPTLYLFTLKGGGLIEGLERKSKGHPFLEKR
jgi:hypothetical protein